MLDGCGQGRKRQPAVVGPQCLAGWGDQNDPGLILDAVTIDVTSASLASFGRRPYGRRGCCHARLPRHRPQPGRLSLHCAITGLSAASRAGGQVSAHNRRRGLAAVGHMIAANCRSDGAATYYKIAWVTVALRALEGHGRGLGPDGFRTSAVADRWTWLIVRPPPCSQTSRATAGPARSPPRSGPPSGATCGTGTPR
jgi:hypothetical protein